MRPFDLTPFMEIMEILGLRVFNIENTELSLWQAEVTDKFRSVSGEIGQLKVERVAGVERNVEAVIKPKKQDQINANLTPLFLVRYGAGKFLISLIFANHEQNKKIKKIIAGMIASLVGRR